MFMSEEKDPFLTKLIDLLLSFRVWILIFFLMLSFFAVNYTTDSNGIVINGVAPGSYSDKAGVSFEPTDTPRNLERIKLMNNEKVESEVQFYEFLNSFNINNSLNIITSKNQYNVEFNNVSNLNKSVKDLLGLSVRNAPTSNIRLGIELEGGSRLILKPTQKLSDEDFDLLINTLQSRLDVYGASGTKVNKLVDSFSKEQFIVVESISSNKNDIFELIKRQGEFKATVGNKTAFTGNNVIRVLNDPGHERLQGCFDEAGGKRCTYAFQIEIDSQGGNQFFNLTKKLGIKDGYLSKKVCFVLDDVEITCLNIASSFKFQKVTSPQITVSGDVMKTQTKALKSAQREMKFLQAILSTQSLPSKLTVEQSYSLSSSLGEKLLKNSVWVGLLALITVSLIVAIRYRNPIIFVGIATALVSEVIIVFGAAAFMRLSIDLASIGGLIAAIGTGVDDQVIITDEFFRKKNRNKHSKNRMKTALTIIMISYLTTVVAMSPFLFSASLSLVKGFAFMIIIGVTGGVFITRPAYAAFLRIMLTTRKERKEEED